MGGQISKNKIFYFSFLLATVIVALYFWKNYRFFEEPISSIEIVLAKPFSEKEKPILYAYVGNSAEVDFANVHKFERINDSVIKTSGLENIEIRKFRIYFVKPNEKYVIKRVKLFNYEGDVLENTDISKFIVGQNVKVNDNKSLNINKKYAYIEYPYSGLYKSPILGLAVVILILTFFLGFFVINSELPTNIGNVSKKSFVFLAFLISIFLFHPIFNIALIVALAYYIKGFKIKSFLANKVNIWMGLFFLAYFLSTILSLQNGLKDFSTVERFLPFVFIPILVNRVRFEKSLYFISICVFIVAVVLFSFSGLDAMLIGNISFFSFDSFSKYYHPVYLSYMLFFSIIFIETEYKGRNKYLLQLMLFALLIFLGSKMVIITAILLYIFFFVDLRENRRRIIWLFAGLIVVFALFRPVQERFKEIVDIDDLSVLKEQNLEPNDSRINGLTLRLILWREALLTMDSWGEYLFGNGASKSKEVDLQERMKTLGLLQHLNYNPHNQYVDTFWRTGILGLLILIGIPVNCFVLGRKHKNKLLMAFSIFMITCMFTESIFGRVRGVYFFITTIIILTNNILYAENSDTWNKRNSE